MEASHLASSASGSRSSQSDVDEKAFSGKQRTEETGTRMYCQN
eukprot:COSAG03_NODE_12065_length_563_cov_0.556034_1_plen_42_part_10